MPSEPYYIGLMSGTSADAIDAALLRFSPSLQLVASHSIPLAARLREDILALTQPGSGELDRMGRLDRRLGDAFAEAVEALLAAAGISRGEVAAVGCHGQTVRHRPDGADGFTLQIGDPNTLAERCGIAVVADFRRRDVAAGGQGAPLVPAFHHAAFGSPARDRVVLNIGGMANISHLPPGQPLAAGFDTGPGNVLMDAWCELHRGQRYDAGGQWARSGQLLHDLLERLLAAPYFANPPPKSTGRELFHADWLRPQLEEDLAPADVQRTLLELTARSIADAIERWAPSAEEVFVCGGGSGNDFLMERLGARLGQRRLDTTAALGLDPQWVEASAFAWLAKQAMLRQPGNLPRSTGASGPRVLGGIYWP